MDCTAVSEHHESHVPSESRGHAITITVESASGSSYAVQRAGQWVSFPWTFQQRHSSICFNIASTLSQLLQLLIKSVSPNESDPQPSRACQSVNSPVNKNLSCGSGARVALRSMAEFIQRLILTFIVMGFLCHSFKWVSAGGPIQAPQAGFAGSGARALVPSKSPFSSFLPSPKSAVSAPTAAAPSNSILRSPISAPVHSTPVAAPSNSILGSPISAPVHSSPVAAPSKSILGSPISAPSHASPMAAHSAATATAPISKPPVYVSQPSTSPVSTSPASTPVKLPSPSSSPMAPSLSPTLAVPVSATPSSPTYAPSSSPIATPSSPTYAPSSSPISTVSPTMEPVSSPVSVPVISPISVPVISPISVPVTSPSPSPAQISPLLAPVGSPLSPAPTVSPQISPSTTPVGSPVETSPEDSYVEAPSPSPSVPQDDGVTSAATFTRSVATGFGAAISCALQVYVLAFL